MATSVQRISRCWVFVNWKKKEIDTVYPETNQGLLAMVGDVAFETGAKEEYVANLVYDRRFEWINELLAESNSSLRIVETWFASDIEAERILS